MGGNFKQNYQILVTSKSWKNQNTVEKNISDKIVKFEVENFKLNTTIANTIAN